MEINRNTQIVVAKLRAHKVLNSSHPFAAAAIAAAAQLCVLYVHHRIGTNHSFELNGYGYPYEMALRITARFAAKGAVIRTALALEAHGRARRSIFRQRTAACDSHFIGKRARNKTKQQRRVRLALRATERKEE